MPASIPDGPVTTRKPARCSFMECRTARTSASRRDNRHPLFAAHNIAHPLKQSLSKPAARMELQEIFSSKPRTSSKHHR